MITTRMVSRAVGRTTGSLMGRGPVVPFASVVQPVASSDAQPMVSSWVKSSQECCPLLSDLTRTPGQFWTLSKGKLTVWVAISAMPGYLIAGASNPLAIAALAVGTTMTSACAQTLNQIIEVERDRSMNRTRGRPLPRGKISVPTAAVYASMMGMGGTTLLTATCNPTTALVAASTAVLYAGVYTPMKTVTGYNTHVGAVTGSLPVLLGFAAAGAPLLGSSAVCLFTLQTLWQFPHFYALAWLHKEDYIKGGFNMFPLTDASGRETAKMILPYMLALAAFPSISAACGATSWMFAVDTLIPNVLYGRSFTRFAKDPSIRTVRSFFLASLWYLIMMLGLFTLHAMPVFEGQEETLRENIQNRFYKHCIHRHMMEMWTILPEYCPVTKKGKGESA